MSIIHVQIEAFPIEVERRIHRQLRSRPVVIAASTARRAPLIEVSQEAQDLGLHKGMLRQEALRRERRLVCLTPNFSLYERAQEKLLQLLARFTPHYFSNHLGSVALDMAGSELLFGKPKDSAFKVRDLIRRSLSLEPGLGIAGNHLVSKVAAQVVGAQGLYEVFPGHEAEFLQPLPVNLLPGIGEVTSKKLLRELGVRWIGDLAEVPMTVLCQIFGKRGRDLYTRARGEEILHSSSQQALVQPMWKSTLVDPSNDKPLLQQRLWQLCERAGAWLRSSLLLGGKILLGADYIDGVRVSCAVDLVPPSHSEWTFFRSIQTRWHHWINRRTQIKAFSLQVKRLQAYFQQIDFTTDDREEKILNVLDQLRTKYGVGVVQFAHA